MKNIALLTLILTLSTQFFFACSERLNLDYARKTASICTIACIAPTTYGALAGASAESYLILGSIGLCGCAACAAAAHIIYMLRYNNPPHPSTPPYYSAESNLRREFGGNLPSRRDPRRATRQIIPYMPPPAQVQMEMVPQQPESDNPTQRPRQIFLQQTRQPESEDPTNV